LLIDIESLVRLDFRRFLNPFFFKPGADLPLFFFDPKVRKDLEAMVMQNSSSFALVDVQTFFMGLRNSRLDSDIPSYLSVLWG